MQMSKQQFFSVRQVGKFSRPRGMAGFNASGAASGASAGMAVGGPWGAAAGALIGGFAGPGGAAGGASAPPSISNTVQVSPRITTEINPQISPVFQQQFQPTNSAATAGTSQQLPTLGGGLSAYPAGVMPTGPVMPYYPNNQMVPPAVAAPAPVAQAGIPMNYLLIGGAILLYLAMQPAHPAAHRATRRRAR